VLARHVVDELLDEHGLADARASEETDLAALHVRGDQIDHLDAGLEDLDGRRQVAEGRRLAVNRPALRVLGRRLVVDRIADDVPHAPQRHVSDGHRDGATGVNDVETARKAVRRVHRDRAHAVVAQMLLHLRDEPLRSLAVGARHLDGEGVVDLGQRSGEDGVDDHALDLEQGADLGALTVLRSVGDGLRPVLRVRVCLVRHSAPGEVFRGDDAGRERAGRARSVYPGALAHAAAHRQA
jgi:hypothetical protein